MLTVTDIQSMLGVSRNTAYKLVRNIPHFNIGTGKAQRIAIKESDYDRWLESRRIMQTEVRKEVIKSASQYQLRFR